ncbi:MAG TPA: type I-U CRISPR-associated protein Csx17 [Hyphomicrobiaceae bacterium]|nr:type I-U CRISPR-associated protein Csx17 [Hyphomicrobiaceae bacterium]
MNDSDKTIDWSKTTFEGSRREQLRRWAALSVRERLEALDRLSEQASRLADKAAAAPVSSIREEPAGYREATKRNEVVLSGCEPMPLAAYLKALAVLRLVAEQAGDPDVTGCWRKDVFVLQTRLTREKLIEFFLQCYEPTPLVAPWNGGSGFYPKDNRDGIEPLTCSKSPRFAAYRKVIEFCQNTVAACCQNESPKNEEKALLLNRLRNQAPDGLLRWMDAAVILSDDDPRYPPLLGTGGNDGRLDFTNNFMQRLGEVFDVSSGEPKQESRDWLATALFGDVAPGLSDRAIGQFAPGSAGGPNSSAGFEGAARINAWDFILMLEGALLFAASAVRRLESSTAAVLSAPFTVRSRLATVGTGASSDDADARGEIWMPLWHAPFTLEEVQSLFSEGRAALGTRPARDGLDFARAVAHLGVDRGIAAFQRYGFLMRSGKAFLATPLARMPVKRNPKADLIDEIGDWLDRTQRHARDDKASQSFRALAAQLDAALFALTQRAKRQAVERVLRLLGRIEAMAAVSPSVREAIAPVPRLSLRWAMESDDGSAEFHIALALAGLSLRGEDAGKPVTIGLRPHLVPVSRGGRDWDTQSRLARWGQGGIERNLAALLHRRRIEAMGMGAEGELLHSRTGAALDDVHRFLSGDTDDRRIAELMHGLACVNLEGWRLRFDSSRTDMPAAYSLLKPFFTAESLLKAIGWLPPDRSLRLPAEIPARLAADDVNAVLRIAWQRLRAIGCKLPGRHPPQVPRDGNGSRLLAALTIPLTFTEIRRLLKGLDFDLEVEADTKFAANTAD